MKNVLSTDTECPRTHAPAGSMEACAGPDFNATVALAAQLCQTPIALLATTDASDALRLVCCHGPRGIIEASQPLAWCQHIMGSDELLEVPDITGELSAVNLDVSADAPLLHELAASAPGGVRFHAGMAIHDANGTVLGALCVADLRPRRLDADQCRSLTTLARLLAPALQSLREQRPARPMDLALQAADVGLWDCDFATQLMQFSPRFLELMGHGPAAASRRFQDWLQDAHPDDVPRLEELLAQTTDSSAPSFAIDCRMRRSNGDYRWVHLRGRLQRDAHGRVVRIGGSLADIGARKRIEQQLHRLTMYDRLTNLPNRRRFSEQLEAALRGGESLAVVMLDLDHFKLVNNGLGHSDGDRLLQKVASRLRSLTQPGDCLGRLDGDEFGLLLRGLDHADDAAARVQAVMAAFDEAFDDGERRLFLSASAGIALYPADGDSACALIRNADIAMYRAKELGRGHCQFYKADMRDRSEERLALEGELRRALANNEFMLHYQPQVDIASGEIAGLEALVRWQHPRLGTVLPSQFIPVLEDNGLIVALGDWVLREVCVQQQVWRQAGCTDVPVAVNLSARQLQQRDLDTRIAGILEDTGADAQWLELEITESVLMGNAEQSADMLQRLRRLGLRLSVDDFGTGYSSLSYLKSFPIHTLKIDRSFVRDITTNPDDAQITRTIISMAHSLRLNVVAEGVETHAQLAFLSANGCDRMQGFLFSPAVPPDEVTQLLQEDRRLPLLPMPGRRHRTLLLVDEAREARATMQRALGGEGYRILIASSPADSLETLASNTVDVLLTGLHSASRDDIAFLQQVKTMYPETVRILLSSETDSTTVADAVNLGGVYKFLIRPLDAEQLRSQVREAFAYRTQLMRNLNLLQRLIPLAEDSRGPASVLSLHSHAARS